MKTRFNLSGFGLLLLAVLLLNSIPGLRLMRVALLTNTSTSLIIVSVTLSLMWLVTIAQLSSWPLKNIIASPLRLGRRFPILYWWFLLLYVVGGVVLWILLYQPAWGKIGVLSQFYFLTWGWLLIFALGYDFERDQLRGFMIKLGNSRATGIMISLTAVLVMLIGGEMALRVFFVRSDSGGMTLSSKHWLELHWKPLNSFGYRDYEIDTSRDEFTQQVLVVGDSFAAGHGIENIADTFPHILEQKLGDDFTVNILAHNGWDTGIQQDVLESFPLQPDTIILSYMLNDIEGAAFANGVSRPTTIPLPTFLDGVVQNFYIANYVWFVVNINWLQSYSGNLSLSFDDEAIWQDHQAQLEQMIEWAARHDTQFVVLIWPYLDALDTSEGPARQVEQFFASREIPVVNMLDVIAGVSPSQRMVSAIDRHPSVYTHQLAAQALYDLLSEQQ